MLTYPLPKLLSQVPKLLHEDIRASRYHRSKDCFVIESGIHKDFSANEREVWKWIYIIILKISIDTDRIHGGNTDVGKRTKSEVRDAMKIIDAEYKANISADELADYQDTREARAKLISEGHKRRAIEK